ncbi:MAG TPA: cation diffusion facilitator family transporter [Candidatus Saccharicenans sp.]|nr:cation diffusion facilitator family transporter [Candidatus Saccharicenans sp.]HUM78574.1 cation diffusion facilitator family transporter [Candidatus Saccharicenans sp.]
MSVDFSQKKKLGYLEGYISIALNTGLFVLKFIVGQKVGSVAMVADAWHTLSDTLTSMVVIVGFWLASRPPDREHVFGHGKAESVASIVIATLLGVVGGYFCYESVLKLIHHETMSFSLLAIIVFAISAVLKEALAQFAFWAGKKADSSSLRADGWHHRSDAIASLLIVVGALFSQRFWWLDGIMGIGVSLLILNAGLTIIRGSASYLIGESPSDEMVKRVKTLVKDQFPQLEGIHHLHVHNYGEHSEVTAHLKVPGNMRVDEAHELATRVEELMKKEFEGDVTIHVEPEKHGPDGSD